ncbi:transcription factor bHLH92-like [Lycium ferocissimum]|uniref:transcription factor bHLH92-like n=1 Tax=Lycium ferocissimum TaxID=112874 RepID=UPI002815B525|nr:transcription factor bHLH92-like [Lycium ferocissimum]XP_059315672.1 transcription factor bHLH92-like [Lycium ferocissimum]
MEEFFQVSWFDNDEANFVVNQSAFVSFREQPIEGFGVFGYESNVSTNYQNMNKRMMEFLKKNWSPKNGEMKMEREKGHKHMIKERIRRQEQKQNYSALHKLLPMGTKGEKNAIVQTAAQRIQELQKYKENLKKRNDELQMILAESEKEEVEKANIKAKVNYPISGVDSMLEVLKCLKNCGTKANAIQSNFSQQEFSTVIEIETKSGAAELEKAVQNTLVEAERNFRAHWQPMTL